MEGYILVFVRHQLTRQPNLLAVLISHVPVENTMPGNIWTSPDSALLLAFKVQWGGWPVLPLSCMLASPCSGQSAPAHPTGRRPWKRKVVETAGISIVLVPRRGVSPEHYFLAACSCFLIPHHQHSFLLSSPTSTRTSFSDPFNNTSISRSVTSSQILAIEAFDFD